MGRQRLSGNQVSTRGLDPDGAVVNVEIHDTSLTDAAAVAISAPSTEAPAATSPFPSALPLLSEALEDPGVHTLSIRIESSDGTLLCINDWVILAFDESGLITAVVAELIALQ